MSGLHDCIYLEKRRDLATQIYLHSTISHVLDHVILVFANFGDIGLYKSPWATSCIF